MAAPYSAGKRSKGEKSTKEQKQAGREKKDTSGGGRAERSKEVHETPQKRGGRRKPAKMLNRKTEEEEEQVRCEDVGPEANNLDEMPTHPEQHTLEEASQPLCPNLTVSPPLPSKQLNQVQLNSPPKLSSQEPLQPPCQPLTDDDEEGSPTLPSKLLSNQPKSYQEPRLQPLPALTNSSDEEGKSETRTRRRILRKNVKRARAKTPTLTSDSEEEKCNCDGEEEPRAGQRGGHLVASMNTAEFRGGGAGGSSYQVWRDLAERIMVGVRRARLPLRLPLDDITEGDGNCYFRALRSQLQRPEVAAPDHVKRLDHRSLRKKICNFMLRSKLPVVKDFEKNWLDFQDSELGDYNRYWMDMRDSRGDIWAEGPVIHATAWFLERDIYVVSERASEAEPFLAFSGNQDGTDTSCAGAALWLGHLTGLHYQTLMPTERDLMPPRPNLRSVEDTLKAKAKAGGGDDQPGHAGTSRISRVGGVRIMHFPKKS